MIFLDFHEIHEMPMDFYEIHDFCWPVALRGSSWLVRGSSVLGPWLFVALRGSSVAPHFVGGGAFPVQVLASARLPVGRGV